MREAETIQQLYEGRRVEWRKAPVKLGEGVHSQWKEKKTEGLGRGMRASGISGISVGPGVLSGGRETTGV